MFYTVKFGTGLNYIEINAEKAAKWAKEYSDYTANQFSQPKEEQPEKIVRELPSDEEIEKLFGGEYGGNNGKQIRSAKYVLERAQPIITRQSKEIEEYSSLLAK